MKGLGGHSKSPEKKILCPKLQGWSLQSALERDDDDAFGPEGIFLGGLGSAKKISFEKGNNTRFPI